MSDAGENNEEIEYDEDGNPIPKADDVPPPPENPPITEDMDIDHEEMNRLLVENFYSKTTENVDGQEILKIIRQGVNRIGMNHNKSEYSFMKLNVKGKKLSNLYDWLSLYPSIRNCDLSDNLLRDISTVTHMKYLQHLDVSNNKIENMDILFLEGQLRFLGDINLSKNKIKKLTKIICPRLYRLNLDENQIYSLEEFNGHDKLEVIYLRKNKLTNLRGLSNCKSLKIIYVNENQLTTFNTDISNLPNLKKINFKLNPIEKIEELNELPMLEQLNFKETQLADKDNVFKLLC